MAGAYDDPNLSLSEIDRRLKAKRDERARLNKGKPQASKNRRRRKGGKR